MLFINCIFSQTTASLLTAKKYRFGLPTQNQQEAMCMYAAKGRRKTRVEKRQRNGCLLTAKRRQFALKVALKKLGHEIRF